MSKSPAHALSNYLATITAPSVIGYLAGTAATWRITTGRQLDKPDSQITFFDYAGLPDNPAYRINYPSVQVRVRGAKDDYAGAWSKINDIKELLNGITPMDLEGDHYSGITAITSVISMGFDTLSRPEFVISFRVFLEPAANNSPFMHRASL